MTRITTSGFHGWGAEHFKPLWLGIGALAAMMLVVNSNIVVTPSFLSKAAPSSICFREVAKQGGLDFILRNDAAGRKYQVETVVGGVAVIDFNNDGWQDIYLVNGASLPSLRKEHPRFSNKLFRNDGDGIFSDVTERAGVQGLGYSMGAAVGDFDNDGWQDLYVCGVNENTLYRNNHDGTFMDITRSAGVTGHDRSGKKLWSVAAAWMDYDNDGYLDLLVSNYCDWTPEDEPVCGQRTYCSPDVYRGQPCLLYHNNGDGTFTDVSLAAGIGKLMGKGMGVAVSDYDNDGFLDAFIANDNARNFLFHNMRNGRFEEVAIRAGVAFNGDGRQISGMGTDFRDYNGDERPDIVMTGLKGETFELFCGLGNQQFSDCSAESGILRLSQPWNGWSCGLVDFDNDGRLDLFVANGGLDEDAPQPNRVFRNSGNGRFMDDSAGSGTDLQIRRLHRGAAFADFDNDGRMDVVVTSLNERAELLMNRGPRRHWIKLKLQGAASNRSAIGARVLCRSASGRQLSWVTSSVGYASSSDLRIHFGLGEDRLAQELEVRWPSGFVQRLTNIPADEVLEVAEPRTTGGLAHPAGAR